MPFPLLVVPPVGCGHWIYLSLLSQVRAQLHTDLSIRVATRSKVCVLRRIMRIPVIRYGYRDDFVRTGPSGVEVVGLLVDFKQNVIDKAIILIDQAY
jgi:hypothetical protein